MADWLSILNDTEIANYANDNTSYPFCKLYRLCLNFLEKASEDFT